MSQNTLTEISTPHGAYHVHSLKVLMQDSGVDLTRLPYSIRVLLENQLRHCGSEAVQMKDVEALMNWQSDAKSRGDIPFKPARVVMQDFTGVPAVVDLAAMRAAYQQAGGDPKRINPLVDTAMVVDHSVQVDYYGNAQALPRNTALEFKRNKERYGLLKWGQGAFNNFKVVPPGMGIIHQVNLEFLSQGIMKSEANGKTVLYPDTLVGTDSHTTMINGLGVLGWGVGGIEAEAVMLGQPYYMLLPDVVGVRLSGQLREGVTATDLVLRITEVLRAHGVVGKFVEYFGPALGQLPLADRATIANMAPEYGATMGFFPVDAQTLEYMRLSGRGDSADLVEPALKECLLFRQDGDPDPQYTAVVDVDLSEVDSTLAGPKRPQDRVSARDLAGAFSEGLTAPISHTGFGLEESNVDTSVTLPNGQSLKHGDLVIAAITSCTNTSNPYVMIGAGLLARNAHRLGMTVNSSVKTSLAPGSQVVTAYLEASGLLESFETLRFNVVGYGCTTCIGNSGPLDADIEKAIKDNDLVVSSVLSGNRNFEGRVHPFVKANYLASPLLVVAYALAGTVRVNFEKDPVGQDAEGNDVFLKDLWPSMQEISEVVNSVINAEMFESRYATVFDGTDDWKQLDVPTGELYDWQEDSTYIRRPDFFDGFNQSGGQSDILDARVLLKMGDSVTTDHISPAGAIPEEYPAGQYLTSHGVQKSDFNSYGSRRGNHEVMMRGTFANVRIRNQLAPGTEGSYTTYLPDQSQQYVYDAAMAYQETGTPLIVLAGKEYGTGSSRDWAAKGTALLGIRAVIAESYERIHRSNLVGMGVLPLQFKAGESADALGLDGTEVFTLRNFKDLSPGCSVQVEARSESGELKTFEVMARIDTPIEVNYFHSGGILRAVMRDLLNKEKQTAHA